jgi:hypothetical protein
MFRFARAAVLGLLLASLASPAAHSQGSPPTAAAVRVWLGPEGQPLPFRSEEELLDFLRTAEVVSMKSLSRGVTVPSRVVLEKNGLRVNAHFNQANQEKRQATMSSGQREFFFRDSYKFNIAAYELARMLGLDNVPPAIERSIYGKKGSLSLWIENAMTERERIARHAAPPSMVRFSRQLQTMKIFDTLIYNTDRTQENILIGPDWTLWMIDHTRAFRRWPDLLQPESIYKSERGLWQRLQSFDEQEARRRLKPYLEPYEIQALLERRRKLVAFIQRLIDQNGEDQILYSLD